MSWKKRFGIMLCQPLDEHNLDRNYKTASLMLVQPKLDGIRAWVDWEGEEPYLISSQGHIINGVPHINLALKELRRQNNNHTEKLDGELYNHSISFEEIVSRVKRTKEAHPDYATIQFCIFDYKSSLPQTIRTDYLEKMEKVWYEAAPTDMRYALKWVPTVAAKREQLTKYLNNYLEAGYEGIIVRNPLAGYVETRPYTILKWKPAKKDWYEIAQVLEAVSEEGIPLGRVGSFICTDRYGNKFNVGPGMGITHEEAKTLWKVREGLVGKYAEIYYQNLTSKGVPRFGKFSIAITGKSGEYGG